MAEERGPRKRSAGKRPEPGDPQRLRVRQVPEEGVWELVHPRCARERKEDLDEVHQMLAMGEIDIAVDELRYLLDGCHALVEAHQLLGEIALADGDLELARAHLGYAFDLGLHALPREPLTGRMPADRSANQPFFEAGKGLALCLMQLGQPELARGIVRRLQELDPQDPLHVGDALTSSPDETPRE